MLEPIAQKFCSNDEVLQSADHKPFDSLGDAVLLLHEENGIRVEDAHNLFTMATTFEMALKAKKRVI